MTRSARQMRHFDFQISMWDGRVRMSNGSRPAVWLVTNDPRLISEPLGHKSRSSQGDPSLPLSLSPSLLTAPPGRLRPDGPRTWLAPGAWPGRLLSGR